jgi:glycerophosphoryl diester phosphodiesterase
MKYKKSLFLAMSVFLIGVIIYINLSIYLDNSFGRVDDKFLIIGHRGASAYAPEHTIKSYEIALELGVDYIELDLQMTKDGYLIAMHDSTVDRTTDGTGKVSNLTLSEIKQLDVGSWFNEEYPKYAKKEYEGLQVPTLDEILKYFGNKVNYYIEIKQPDENLKVIDKLLEAISQYGLIENVIIQSFSINSLKEINVKQPKLTLIYLGNPENINFKEAAKYADGVGLSYLDLNKQHIEKAHELGLVVHCWTVDDKKEIKKLLEWNVDGIFTNKPDLTTDVDNFNK